MALACAMSVTVSAGVVEEHLSRRTNLFNLDRCMHIQILSELFFGVTTIGAHHSVGSVTGAMIPWLVSKSISFLHVQM